MRLVMAFLLFATLALPAASLAGQWQGVDETVVEKVAQEHGRAASTPLINPSGDMLLFVFTVSGAAGGFMMGYFYRMLFAEKGRKKDKR